jgi:hypothetical protein
MRKLLQHGIALLLAGIGFATLTFRALTPSRRGAARRRRPPRSASTAMYRRGRTRAAAPA